jgi:crossover junction endodeoxyribonuclease RuvC
MGITSQQFKKIQERLAQPRRAVSPVLPALEGLSSGPPNRHSVILGLDPSLRGTGYGIIRLARPCPDTLGHGTVSCPAAWPRSRCLARIAQALREVLKEHRPTVCIVEGLFYAQNLQTALLMGEARGAALSVVAEAGLEIYELAPRKVKQAIVGYGAAQKTAVARMVQRPRMPPMRSPWRWRTPRPRDDTNWTRPGKFNPRVNDQLSSRKISGSTAHASYPGRARGRL